MRKVSIALVSIISLMVISCRIGSGSSGKSAAAPLPEATDCFWVGPWSKENDELNFGYLDAGAVYWLAVYSLPEDNAYVTLDHEYPHSRYMSLTTYGTVGGVVDALVGREISPKNGSTNPFIAGNPRNDPSRRYSVTVEPGLPDNAPNVVADNVLYQGAAKSGEIAVLFYRLYVPDNDTDIEGGTGLPRVTLHLADGGVIQGEEACNALTIPYEPSPFYAPADEYSQLREQFDPSGNPPVFRSQYGRPFQWQCDFAGDCSNSPPYDNTAGFVNTDARYMYSFLNRNHGQVLAIRGRLPETPKTLTGDSGVFIEGQLRYWSLCEYGYYSQKLEACLFDEQIGVNDDGFYTIVTSRPEDRPDNATEECGVGYIPWPMDGDGFGVLEGRVSHPNDGYVLVRNVLPSSDFMHAIQNTQVAGDESTVMGEYLPRGHYFSKEEFEGLGCNPWLSLPYHEI